MTHKTSHTLSRLEFVKGFTALTGGLIGLVLGLPAVGYLITPALKQSGDEGEFVSAGPLENYPLGEPTLFSFTRTRVNGWEKTSLSYGVYVLRQSQSEVTVFSNICTHLACRVSWKPELQEYVSPCHDGHFDKTGNVTKGPPPRPLDHHKTKIENGTLFVSVEKFIWTEV